MKLTQVLPAAAVVGLLLATLVVFRSNTKKPASVPVAQPAEAPYASYIGGSGIIEASNQNISIGTSLPGIVKTVAVKVGDMAKAGRPLFQIDDRELRADLLVSRRIWPRLKRPCRKLWPPRRIPGASTTWCATTRTPGR